MSGDLPKTLPMFDARNEPGWAGRLNEIARDYNILPPGDPRRAEIYQQFRKVESDMYEDLFD